MTGTVTSCNNSTQIIPTEDNSKNDIADAKQALLSFYDFTMTRDLSNSLTFNQWTSFFTKDFLWGQSKGEAPVPMGNDGFTFYRGVFKTVKASYDGITIDHVDASGDLAYVLFHLHEVVTTIKTNELARDVLFSGVVTLKKDEAGNWKIAFLGYA